MSKNFVIRDEGVKKLRRAKCKTNSVWGGGVGGESLLHPHKTLGGLKVKNAKSHKVLCSGGFKNLVRTSQIC